MDADGNEPRPTRWSASSVRHCITFAENEEASPWEPYHVQWGYEKDESAVTVFYVWGNVWAEYLRTYWQEKLQAMICGLEPGMGCTLVLDPIVAREFVERGLETKETIVQWLHENARIPQRRHWDHVMLNLIHEEVEAGVEPFASYWKAPPDELIPVFRPLIAIARFMNLAWGHAVLDHQDVAVVERDRAHAHAHLSGSQREVGPLRELEPIDAEGVGESPGSHAARSAR